MSNGFIAYLNSMHNLSSDGANALAESQALNRYFGEVYTSFPLVSDLVNILTDEVHKVVILTGHAGDGKSTVALDVFKTIKDLPKEAPLEKALQPREDLDGPNGPISIIKDMSELSASDRRSRLEQAFSNQGSWLIISNTGPLLESLSSYSKENGAGEDIESEILKCLDFPLAANSFDRHTLDTFDKPLVILNLTQVDNVGLGAEVLTKLANHSAWEECNGCEVEASCPLQLNRKAIRDAGNIAEDRVRFIYHRLREYEQRLTLRQIVAQLAFALTGGMGCDEACQIVQSSTADDEDKGTKGLENILFSEGFFGYKNGKPFHPSAELKAVSLMKRIVFGAPVGVDYERQLQFSAGLGWAILPNSLKHLENKWRKKSEASEGGAWRFALRRMTYLFGDVQDGSERKASIFLDALLKSNCLRDYDQWRRDRALTLSTSERKQLTKSCLNVLLEYFSGFNASQFGSKIDKLYLTLRRADKAVMQPTQLVIDSMSFRDFKIEYDQDHNLPVLSFKNGLAQLPLALPLLDFIRKRDAGEIGGELSLIHQSQLDWFRTQLLMANADNGVSHDDIELLRSGIDGGVHLHRLMLDQEHNTLEQS